MAIDSLVGGWLLTSDQQSDDSQIRISERKFFDKDGAFSSEGTIIISVLNEETEEEFRMITMAFAEVGTWQLNDQTITEYTKEFSTRFFSSCIEEYDRQKYDEDKNWEKPTVTQITKIDGRTLHLYHIDEEGDETISEMTPIEALPEPDRPFATPLLSVSIEELEGDPTVRPEVKIDQEGESIRQISLSILYNDQFHCAHHLPTFRKRNNIEGELREMDSIVSRLLCLFSILSWACSPEKLVPSIQIEQMIDTFNLNNELTESEKEILSFSRKDANKMHLDNIGWRLENVWALAWVLGYEDTPDIDQGQIPDEVVASLLDFLNPALEGKEAFCQNLTMRSFEEIVQLEDLFYCAHNAIRSAQTGNLESVPEGFHPVIHGGVIHEKRHALSWILTPNTKWDEIDLSS